RVKNVDFDEDDLYSDEEGYEDGQDAQGYTAEDKENFANLTPVVRAELEEAGIQVTSTQIEEALWHYYWDVGKSVAYLKNSRTPRPPQTQQQQQEVKKNKPKSKFDEAQQKSADIAGEPETIPSFLSIRAPDLDASTHAAQDPYAYSLMEPLDTSASQSPADSKKMLPPNSAAEWFKGTPWTNVPEEDLASITATIPVRPAPHLLGGSSKLAKLAEERRRKAAATQQSPQPTSNDALSSLDRLSRASDAKENAVPVPKMEPKKYPIRRKKEPSPPPREPTPSPEEPKEVLPDLRASPTAFGQTLSTSPASYSGAQAMTLQDLLGTSSATNPFEGPSPDDVVSRAQERSKGLNKNSPEQAKATQSTNGLAKKTEALKLDATGPAQPKLKSKGLDVPSLWEKESSKRGSAAFVVIGHVDHGKSTLMGRLLLDTGAVAQRDIDKYKKQATEMGKASFALAWVMDTGSEERARGVTVDIAQHHFSTDSVDFTILDAPGHRDFVPNMIGGASMAELAVLVVDANQLESGMKGQTREHILLAHAVGLRRIVVAVNKLDATTPAWSEGAFRNVRDEVLKLLATTGFSRDNVAVIPCSGLSGENVVSPPPEQSEAAWVRAKHPSLLQQLEKSASSRVSAELIKAPARMQVADVFRGGITNPISISGLLRSGSLQTGETIIVQPSGESASIKGIEVQGASKEWTVAGQIPTLHLQDIDAQHLRSGDVACGGDKPVKVVKNVIAQVTAFESLLPQEADVHIGRLHAPGHISQLFSTLNAKDEVIKKKPRIVKAGQRAVIRLGLDDGVPLEAGDRIVLRSEGNTIAAGTVQQVGS
ncbi:Elongation factor 1-alpha, partial [Pseudocercospora fuligena]